MPLKNYYEYITDHKEVIRGSISLQGAMLVLKDDIARIGNVSMHIMLLEFVYIKHLFLNVQMYLRYSYLWAENKNEQIEEFVSSEPYVYEIKEKFIEYDELIIEINDLPDYHVIGCLRINMGIYLIKYFEKT